MKGKRYVEITIVMNESEAIWLKNVMTNPLHGQKHKDEGGIDRDMREMFWKILNEEGIKLRNGGAK